MRAAIYSLLNEDNELHTLGIQRVYASPTVDTPNEQFFLVLRWLDQIPAFKMVGSQDLQVWIHSKEADYFKIVKVIERVKFLMTNTFHRQGSDGVFSQAEWSGDSTDFRDDAFRTYGRTSGFRCNGGVNVD